MKTAVSHTCATGINNVPILVLLSISLIDYFLLSTLIKLGNKI